MKKTITTMLLGLLLSVGAASALPTLNNPSVAVKGEPESSLVETITSKVVEASSVAIAAVYMSLLGFVLTPALKGFYLLIQKAFYTWSKARLARMATLALSRAQIYLKRLVKLRKQHRNPIHGRLILPT
ncbi:hypothetical protein OX90_11285 [Pseudomonas coronafaciens pv. porri]|uniref:Uncharacterized protein n=1 Tax=Pseudomonas coronafaciens pv. porri TaxID=83964 RepID=A0ABR5JPY8_9PSED|nr:hypothetical protein [Pseudomonas coronafaciens]KOP59458.1 hypothetical protein OX90_11285 [Pseudomonas coronafaciens pv. porri]